MISDFYERFQEEVRTSVATLFSDIRTENLGRISSRMLSKWDTLVDTITFFEKVFGKLNTWAIDNEKPPLKKLSMRLFADTITGDNEMLDELCDNFRQLFNGSSADTLKKQLECFDKIFDV